MEPRRPGGWRPQRESHVGGRGLHVDTGDGAHVFGRVAVWKGRGPLWDTDLAFLPKAGPQLRRWSPQTGTGGEKGAGKPHAQSSEAQRAGRWAQALGPKGASLQEPRVLSLTCLKSTYL